MSNAELIEIDDEPVALGRGRPTKYRPEYAEQAEKLCRLGARDIDLADFFGVTTRTIERWKIQNDDFCRALTIGKDVADDAVERSLFHKAVGYEQEAVKIFLPKDSSVPVYAPFREKIAPDTGAAIFWLKNRRSQKWRDRHEQVNLNVTIAGEFEDLVKSIRRNDVDLIEAETVESDVPDAAE